MRHINEIIIHCSASKEGQSVTLQDIDMWHKQRGFNGIGYHFVISIDGEIWKGRNISIPGAHCVGHNSNSIGICYVGGLDVDGKTPKDTRNPRQRIALNELVSELKKQYPKVSIHGHNEFANKACPSFDVGKEYK